MGKFTHYLVTRFNIPVEVWASDKGGKSVRDKGWMEHRLHLFKKYCVPSVMAQSEKNFHWIIYCDTLSTFTLRDEIMDAVKEIKQVSLRYVPNMADMSNDLQALLQQSDHPYVITTRLDNDDALEKDFIRRIQTQFVPEDRILINLQGGYFYHPEIAVVTRLNISEPNNFISLIETSNAKEILSVFGFPHTQIPLGIKMIRLREGFHWLRIIHARNIRSELKGRPVWKLNTGLKTGFAFTMKISGPRTLLYILKRAYWKLFI